MEASKLRTKVSQQVLDEASTWFVEFTQGDLDTGEREQFNAWLRRSPEHVQAYLQIATLWEDATLMGKGRLSGHDELIARAIADGNVVPLEVPGSGVSRSVRLPADVEPSQPPLEAPRRLRFLAAAAAIFIAIVGAATWYQMYRAATYSTDIGEQRSVRLSDGSTVEINSRSKLRVRFSERERLVELLEGQALFRVARDPKRPFIVDSDETRIRAVGTQFDVYRRSTGTVVTVLEGRVAVGSPLIDDHPPVASSAVDAASASAAGRSLQGEQRERRSTVQVSPPSTQQAANAPEGVKREGTQEHEPLSASSSEILLAAGQRLTVGPLSFGAPEPANIEVATAWTRREIVLQGSPLSEVIEEFNRYNPRKMVIADPGLRDTRISGVFSSTDPNSLLRFLSDLPNVTVQETQDEIRISGR